jgi:hypothetical protein
MFRATCSRVHQAHSYPAIATTPFAGRECHVLVTMWPRSMPVSGGYGGPVVLADTGQQAP